MIRDVIYSELRTVRPHQLLSGYFIAFPFQCNYSGPVVVTESQPLVARTCSEATWSNIQACAGQVHRAMPLPSFGRVRLFLLPLPIANISTHFVKFEG